ncbi:hypothetical protein ASG01_08380 [Chryseobacterium sp. Leaf180]|nr:hypothetical protein ASG01_08380 [Chryseobacterium sp. Leaf180]
MKIWGFYSVFYLIFAVFCLLTIFVGFDYYDSGFILALSSKLNDGQIIYRDFDYVRPFGTPVFWAILLKPFFFVKDYLYLICRMLVLMQFAVISYQVSRVIFNNDRWDKRMLISIPFLMISNINIFPAMPWHTIDGLFFLSLSLFYLHKKNILLAILFSIIAATTKQSFFLIPFLLTVISVFFHRRFNFKLNLKFFLILASCIIILLIFKIPDALYFYRSVSLDSNKKIIYDVGFEIYLDSFKYIFPFLGSAIIAILIWIKIKNSSSFVPNFIGIFLGFCFLIPFYHYVTDYYSATPKYTDYTILSSANALLPITVFLLIYSIFKDRKKTLNTTLTEVCAATIIWSSAISWGAGNIFLAFPFVFLTLKSDSFFSNKIMMILLPLSILNLRIINPYLEKNIFEERYIKLENLPVYSGIYTSKSNAEYLAQSKVIFEKYKNILFLPGFPAASVMFEKTKNRMPWEMNVEYPNYKKDLSLLHCKNLYFVVDKKSFSYDKNSFYGSSFTDEVKKKKTKIDSTGLFYIYK